MEQIEKTCDYRMYFIGCTENRQITKRGSPFLRRTLWQMAFQVSQHDRKFYLRRRKLGQHHLSAITATALRLCHIVWRIMTDE